MPSARPGHSQDAFSAPASVPLDDDTSKHKRLETLQHDAASQRRQCCPAESIRNQSDIVLRGFALQSNAKPET
jgi:hypothetical protein